MVNGPTIHSFIHSSIKLTKLQKDNQNGNVNLEMDGYCEWKN